MTISNLYEEIPNYMYQEARMNKDCILIKRIEDIGEARAILRDIMTHKLFQGLCKHSTKWQHENETIDELLDETRRELSNLQYLLDNVMEVLERDYD